MTYTAYIKNNQTNEIRKYEFDGEYNGFIWTEGNFACDCNRALFFAEANKEEDPDVECGEDKFTVIKVNQNGKDIQVDEQKV